MVGSSTQLGQGRASVPGTHECQGRSKIGDDGQLDRPRERGAREGGPRASVLGGVGGPETGRNALHRKGIPIEAGLVEGVEQWPWLQGREG